MRRKIHNTVDGIYRDTNDGNPAEVVNIRLVSGTLPTSSVNYINDFSNIIIRKISDSQIIISGNSKTPNVDITIFDTSGQKIDHQKIKGGSFDIKFDLNNKGIYLIKDVRLHWYNC